MNGHTKLIENLRFLASIYIWSLSWDFYVYHSCSLCLSIKWTRQEYHCIQWCIVLKAYLSASTPVAIEDDKSVWCKKGRCYFITCRGIYISTKILHISSKEPPGGRLARKRVGNVRAGPKRRTVCRRQDLRNKTAAGFNQIESRST